MERETRLVSCSLAFNGNSAFCFQQFHRFQTKALQPQLARATRFVARSSPLTKTNKKHPSDDECSLLAGDEARTRDILLGKLNLKDENTDFATILTM